MLTQPAAFGPFTRGVNNRLADFALTSEHLRNGVNIDLDNSGHAQRRNGRAKIVSGTAVRSGWSDGADIYFADGTALKRCTPAGTAPYSAVTVATVDAASNIAFEKYLGRVYWTDSHASGQIVNGISRPWGIVAPAAAPTLTAGGGGQLFDGQYQATYTYLRADGEESGAPMTSQVEISNHDRTKNGTGTIAVSGIVASTDPSVTAIGVYCTAANGQIPFRVATMPNIGGTAVITSIDDRIGAELQTQFFRPPPAGSRIFGHGSRMYIVAGNFIHYTERFAPGWYAVAGNWLPFAGPIRTAIPVKDGIYVATDSATFWLPGMDPSQMSAQVVLPYGAVGGTETVIENGETVAWMGQRGIVVATAGGQVQAVQENEVAVEVATRGAMGYREVNGLRQLVCILFDGAKAPMQHKDFAASEASRLATVLP